MVDPPLRFASFLAPCMFPVYGYITRYLGRKLGRRTELVEGSAYDQLNAEVDVGFICGLPYVQLIRRREPPIDLLAAPVLQGKRYGGRPIYFSDVIVRRDSSLRKFADLRGCSWSYNEPLSHSGYGVTRYHLARLGERKGYFGQVVEAGYHQKSIHLVCSGAVDASAIDSHVLSLALGAQPELANRVRVIDTLGPSTIQPVVAARRLPEGLKAELKAGLLEMNDDPEAKEHLSRGLVDRFVGVTDSTYDDIREMLAAAEAADFLTLR